MSKKSLRFSPPPGLARPRGVRTVWRLDDKDIALGAHPEWCLCPIGKLLRFWLGLRPCRFEAMTSERDNTRNFARSFEEVNDLTFAVAQGRSSRFLSQLVATQKGSEVFARHCLMRELFNAWRRHIDAAV